MLQTSNVFNKSKSSKEQKTVRTLSFQGDTFQEHFLIADLGFCYGPGMKGVSERKEPEIRELYRARNISVFNNPNNKSKMEAIELSESELGSIYHWITLDGKVPISIEQVANHIVELLHYYKLGGTLVYDLEIPSDEIVILGHPDAPVKEQSLEQSLKGDEYWGDYVEAVTMYVDPSWIKGTFKLKYGEGKLEFHPVTVTDESMLKSVRVFKYNTTVEINL